MPEKLGSLYERWVERAAIMEFEGGVPRREAERRALQEIVESDGRETAKTLFDRFLTSEIASPL